MPELPEVVLYLHALRERILGETLASVRVRSPSLLRSFDPPLREARGRTVVSLSRLGKRVVIGLGKLSAPAAGSGAPSSPPHEPASPPHQPTSPPRPTPPPAAPEPSRPEPHAIDPPAGELFLVIHLMIAGRFQWRRPAAPIPRKLGHAAFDFAHGTLVLTEASSHKRTSLHLVRGASALAGHDPGGIEPLAATANDFRSALRRENRTLKRALTDPRLVSGIGNAHSDEILWRARLSPVTLTSRLDDDEINRLFAATRSSLREWCARLIDETADRFPAKVTAFHPAMAVHGRYRKPCPRCGAPVQRIVYATRETNYCAACQTGGRLLADRALSRLLGKDWPRKLEDLEAGPADRSPIWSPAGSSAQRKADRAGGGK